MATLRCGGEDDPDRQAQHIAGPDCCPHFRVATHMPDRKGLVAGMSARGGAGGSDADGVGAAGQRAANQRHVISSGLLADDIGCCCRYPGKVAVEVRNKKIGHDEISLAAGAAGGGPLKVERFNQQIDDPIKCGRL